MVRLKNRREISSCQIKTSRKRNLFSILFIILVAIVGGIPTIVITGYIPVMIAQKIYRKVKYGYSLYR